MAAASVTKSLVHLEEDLYLNSTLPIKGFYQATVTLTTPTQAGASTAATATGTVTTGSLTGVALGDPVLFVAPTTALPSGQVCTGATVTAADTVTFLFDSTSATTGASRHADAYQTLTMGAEYIGDDNACGAIKKDGTYCSASKVKTRERCIGHLRGSQEGE